MMMIGEVRACWMLTPLWKRIQTQEQSECLIMFCSRAFFHQKLKLSPHCGGLVAEVFGEYLSYIRRVVIQDYTPCQSVLGSPSKLHLSLGIARDSRTFLQARTDTSRVTSCFAGPEVLSRRSSFSITNLARQMSK